MMTQLQNRHNFIDFRLLLSAAIFAAVLVFSGCATTDSTGQTGAGQAKTDATRTDAAARSRSLTGGADNACIQGDCDNGEGTYLYANGDKYTGHFKNQKRDGAGLFEYVNGDRFTGNFSSDQKQGHGEYRFKNGDIFSGEFKDSRREGSGSYKFADGPIFEGEFTNDGADGKGSLKTTGQAERSCVIKVRSVYCDQEAPRPTN